MRHIHQSGPIITHCSAGIGRSGTLICIDVVLGLISKDADVSMSTFILRRWSSPQLFCQLNQLVFLFMNDGLLLRSLSVVWHFRCRKEYEASKTRNGPNWGTFQLFNCLILKSTGNNTVNLLGRLLFFTLSFSFIGAIYFLLSSDLICAQMSSSRGENLRIVETTYPIMLKLGEISPPEHRTKMEDSSHRLILLRCVFTKHSSSS